jgi:hypothetical protein
MVVQCLVKSARMSQPRPIYSYVSAAVLALVTIFTFYVYRNFGPQSVIRRFHIDAVRGNTSDLDRVCTEPLSSSEATNRLYLFVRGLVRRNVTYEIRDIRRLRHVVLVTVEYRRPDGAGLYVVWHVLQGPSDWRIDCDATLKGDQPDPPGTDIAPLRFNTLACNARRSGLAEFPLCCSPAFYLWRSLLSL